MAGRNATRVAFTWQDAGAVRLLAAVGIALLTVSLSSAHAAPGRNGRLLLLTCDAVPPGGKGASHLRTMRPDGTGFRTILRFEAVGTYDNCSIDQATWSPNGKTVLYSTFRGIWTIRGADGKRKRSVLDVGSHAAWAPSGREVAFVQRVEESQADALFSVRVDGSGLRRITPPIESDIYGPSWSPDGRTIAFTVYDNGQESIWTVGANGSRLRKIAEKARMPGWSPDGRRIIFTDRLSILTMAPDGSRRRYVTPPVLEDETFQATYSPDGSKIAYVRDWRLWVMTARGKRAHIVSPVDALVWRVDWQRR
jgi:Tol biopolymer transport system component